MATRENQKNESDKAAEAGRNAAEETVRSARVVADEAANVGEDAARAGADAARRGAETVRNAMQASLDTANDAFRRMTDQFTNALGFAGPQAEELARRSSRTFRAVTEAGSVLTRGAQEISHEVFGHVQERVQKNAEAVNRIAGVRSVQDFVAVQSDLARDNLQQVIDLNKRIAERSLRIADEAARIIRVEVDAETGRARRAA
jgi:phasin family protein